MALNVEKIKLYLLPTVIFFISIFALVFFILPGIDQIMIARDELSQLEEQRAKLADKAAILESVDEQALKEDLAAGEVSLPSDKDVSGIITGLDFLAASSGAKLTTFSTVVGKLATASAETDAGTKSKEGLNLPNNVKTISVEAALSGNYQQVQEFLSNINKVNRLLGVDKIIVDPALGKLTLLVFYQPLVLTLGDIATPVQNVTPVEREALHKAKNYSEVTPELPQLPTGKPNPFQ